MKKILSILMILAMLASCALAGAEATVVNAASDRGIKLQPAGENTVPENVSPVTGRDLTTLPVPDGFLGMVATGVYYPVLVQHNGYASGTGNAAPWNGSYADVIYEQPKAQAGYTRMTMLFNDYYPQYVGASRSIRVGHVWVRQEWDAMLLHAGAQEAKDSKYNTSVPDALRALGISRYETDSEKRVIYNALDGFSPNKLWTKYRYRVKGLASSYNVVWDLQALSMEIFPQNKEFPNHTWKFTDELPTEGDDASRVYIMFNKDHFKTGDVDKDDGVYYFNSVLEYEPDENVYYRTFLDKLSYTSDGIAVIEGKLFTELVPSNVKISKLEDQWYKMSCDKSQGEAITFSNVIVQFIDMKWPSGEQPYPILTGTGNADYFMGGKHISGMWKRDTYNDRTVYYGADGEEISLQRGKTLIVLMDYDSVVNGAKVRQVSYE